MRAKSLIVCADDFAFDDARNAAILRLASSGRISAVSCLTDAPSWRRAGVALRDLDATVAVGVHFNLTERYGHGERPLVEWMLRALARRIDGAAVRAELTRQLDKFTDVLGRRPDYIDGHQHVHAFPVIREIVQAVAAELARERPIRVRAVSPPFGATDASFKRRVIQLLARGAWPEGAAALRMNGAFGGDYSLTAAAPYARLFADWIAAAPDGAMVMCHPACGEQAPAAALQEFDFLSGDEYAALLAAHGVELVPRATGFGEAAGLTAQSTGV